MDVEVYDVAGVLRRIIDRLVSRDFLYLSRWQGVVSHLDKLQKNLSQIQAVLVGMETCQSNGDPIIFLDDLVDLAYNVDDVLDELATCILESELMAKGCFSISKVRSFIPACFTASTPNLHRVTKLIDITDRFEKLLKVLSPNFKLYYSPIHRGSSIAARELPLPTSLPTQSRIYGRDEDKEKILEMVLNEESNDFNFSVISIVGIRGIGKTRLVQEVYNDKALEGFNIRAWVNVSFGTTIDGIHEQLLQQITLSSCTSYGLQEMRIALAKAVIGKKFLFVLDDVWIEASHAWDFLFRPFKDGAAGSKIIVTTCNVDVEATMRPSKCYNLNLLTKDACLAIFEEHASGIRGFNPQRTPPLIREKVVEKIGGLPLAASTLGGMLRFEHRSEWENRLNERTFNDLYESRIVPVLEITCSRLPSYLRECFAYCANLHEDYEFEEKELVILWVADGLIHPPSVGTKTLKDVGVEYFQALLKRSIFQPSSSNASKFRMHGFFNRLARRISVKRSFKLEEDFLISERFDEIRYFSYICGNYDRKENFEILHRMTHLRTFLPIVKSGNSHYLSNMVLFDLLPKLKKLRALSLESYYITMLPDSIGDLKLLRYLNLSNTEIKSLPESTSLLFNLQCLILKHCSRLIRLPSNVGSLINLYYLDITGVKLANMPLGMENLKGLHVLSNFVVGKNKQSCIEVLKNLKFLSGELYISRLENVVLDFRGSILADKKYLEVLVLEWGSQHDDSRDKTKEKEVLDMLQPHKNLSKLTIKCYGGLVFPSWVGDPSYSNMVVLRLENCEQCTTMPSLGQLSFLKVLTIKGMGGLNRIGLEIYGENCARPFPSLETLCFEDLQEWEYWDLIKENEQVNVFTCLQELSILDCPKLYGRLPDHLSSLEKLVIRECKRLVVSFNCLPSLKKLLVHECRHLVVSISSLHMLHELEVVGCERMVSCSPCDFKSLKSMTLSNISETKNWFLQGSQKVEHLKIVNCEWLINSWLNSICLQKLPERFHSLTSLTELSIENCNNLVSFPEASFLSALSVLKIRTCSSLKFIFEGMSNNDVHVENLQIEDCHSLTFLARRHLPPFLKQLSLINCKKLQGLLDDKNYTCSSSMSLVHKEDDRNVSTNLLEYLHVSQCPSLTCLSSRDQLFVFLKHLDIRDCLKLQLLQHQLPATLEHLEISGCSELIILSTEGLLPKALKHLDIADCPKLKSIAKSFDKGMFVGFIQIKNCKNLEFIPEGIHNLNSLHTMYVQDCPSLVSFPAEGFPDTNSTVLSIERCNKLEALPIGLHNRSCLQQLVIWQCPGIMSIPKEGFPTNLTSLSIADANLFKSLFEWGLHNLTHLRSLEIRGCPDVISFPIEEMNMVLPTSLTHLTVRRFPKLKYLSSRGFETLRSLQELSISDCPELSSLPKSLPSSLLQLYIYNCPLLKKQCRRNKGEEWPKIADIPRVRVDYEFIYDT
ncbi:putative disease resistance RPP13-like protein 1 isoform X1 [Mangifera indica]|uniref:putative disease resistance RPP13-like protein 1 isoform X1 n=1 Tax=Mangifera indica TaxID=29780 RepID=UPI001CFA3D25|nr:putative disease resistance RPP13-like protein 1 isoform X1 [Mangifera indica]XP_044480468.1 putative disease resistance RPP13-like protein 1 isoform X1 [Mangifera indica]XP_044480469.1 putative disease resistance RPP13-like protein 1 isoform X1 [Mangifera indica]XP_044480470.1 putative disease resistance RPP13-like protein 1 isoform X2 [Mangifera indica]XP_044480471.1 putative disease resistance RPP13-like protein 1 isoform X1 [Mangifera indica]XP_044480472.1 putative disease resistance RP